MKKKFTILITAAVMLLTMMARPVTVWGQTTVTQTNFTNYGGNLNGDSNVSYQGYKGGGTSTPYATSGYIRLYQNSSGETGGYIVIGVPENYYISSATIQSTSATTTGYKLTATSPGNTTPAKNTFDVNNYSLSANTDYTVSDISSRFITFACFGTTSSTRLQISKISITYQSSGGTTTYTVTYDANGGSGTMTDENSPYEAGATVTVLGNTFIRPYYSFENWNTASDGNGTDYEAGDEFTINSNITLYAQWAAQSETGVATLTQSNLELTGSYSSGTEKTINGITYVHTDLMKNNDNIQAKASTGTIKNTTPYPGNIISVTITHSGTARATTINGSADGTNWTQVATGSGSINADFSDKGYKFFQITRGSNAAYWEKIDIVYSNSGGSSQSTSDLTITNASTDLTFDLYSSATAQVINYTTSSTGAITITPETSTYFSYVHDAVNKTITVTPLVVTPSAQTVTISQAADDNYYAGSATFTVSVANSDPDQPGSQNHPYTVAEARAAIDAGTGIIGVYATGIVSENIYYSTTNHYITYNISSDGLTTSDQLQAFHGRNLNNTDFTSEDDIQVGDVVVIFGNLTKYNSTYEFADGNYLISLVRQPVITATPSPLAVPNYVVGTAEPDYETLIVNGSNLSANISLALNDNSNFEMSTDLENWTNSLTLTQSEGSVADAEVAIRLKAGLVKGNYAGTVTLTSTYATNVVVDLNGSVLGNAYTIEQYSSPATAHGTITFSPASPIEEGTQVTLMATPDDGYVFTADSWEFYNASTTEPVSLTVTDGNKITMPTCNLAVDATFTEKPKHAITKVVTPENSGTIATDDTAWEGKEVTVLVEAASGYAFLSIVISKTDEPETTIETSGNVNDGFTFTMPGYAVTATATFISNVFEGSFIKVTTLDALEDGGYYVLYDTKAMNSTISSGKMGATVVEVVDDVITNPNRAIVWKLVKNGDNWDLFSEKEAKYCYISTTSSTSAFVMALSSFYHYNISKYDDGGFKFQTTASGGRGIGFGGNEDFRTYTSGNNPKVYLYKYTVLTERTITFDGNGGETENEETTYTQTVYDGVATNLDPNQFTFGSSIFMGWSTTQDGEVEYADEASITVNGDITLYAQWETGYTAMVDDDIDGGSVYIVTATGNEEIIEAAAGTEITLTYTADLGYAFSAWNVYYTDENEQVVPVEVNDDKFTMPAYDVTISAGFEEVTTYSLVTNIDQIVSGKHYIIVGKKNNVVKAMGYDKGNNRHAVEVSETNSTIAKTDGVYEFVINGPIVIDETNYYTIYDTNEESTGYLYAAGGSSNNYLKTQPTNNNKGQWTIDIAEATSVATIRANASGRNLMQYNASSTIFSCYSGNQDGLYLYVKVNDNDLEYYGTEINYAQDEIPADETITVGTGSVMTITSNSFTNNDPANLIIEDGGQLIHDNAGVEATIKKNITGYGTGTGNYYFLVSPFADPIAPLNVINMIATPAENYDLYQWDGGETLEWKNYKQAQFDLINGKGYLYANKNKVELTFTGALKQSNEDITVEPEYNATADFGDWTLVGNPFACDAYIIGTTTSMAFYRMKSTGDGFETATGAIKPMEGIFVQTPADEQSFKFTRNEPSKGVSNLNLQVAQVTNSRDAQPATDNAIIRFDNGNALEKFSFRDNTTKVYIPQGNKDYAVVSAEAQGEMPVNFKAEEDGTYTISFNTENVKFGYLHLIDNKTGNDIDLLQTSSYTFEASRIDYASRFRLVFSAIGNENDSENNDFGFFDANGNLLILGNEGTATLQVMDVMGRVISNETFSGDYSKAINAKAGVYMLRLIQGNDVRTQKIVVR